jgi:hypothetical protein
MYLSGWSQGALAAHIQVVSIQPSERWMCEMRNSSTWPLKGSAISGYVPRDAKGS